MPSKALQSPGTSRLSFSGDPRDWWYGSQQVHYPQPCGFVDEVGRRRVRVVVRKRKVARLEHTAHSAKVIWVEVARAEK